MPADNFALHDWRVASGIRLDKSLLDRGLERVRDPAKLFPIALLADNGSFEARFVDDIRVSVALRCREMRVARAASVRSREGLRQSVWLRTD